MSSSLVKPSVTPLIAFWARARARPWKARCCRSSFERMQVSSPSFSANEIPGGTGVCSFPFGPWTERTVSETPTFTSLGTTMTLRPTRDILERSLPDVDEDLAAHAFPGRAAPGHEAAGGGQDVDAQAAVHAGDLVLAAVDPAAGTADPLQVRDHALHARAVLEVHAQDALLVVLRHLEVGHVALVLQDAGDLHLQLGRRDVHPGQLGADPIPDPADHVRDGIGHVHLEYLLGPVYQLALMTPGMSPDSANWRKQMRHISNFLKYPRGRPHRRHRVYLRT